MLFETKGRYLLLALLHFRARLGLNVDPRAGYILHLFILCSPGEDE